MINVIDKVKGESFEIYYQDFMFICNKTFKLLKIEHDYNISVIQVDDNQIKEINRTYRNIDRETDVISFALKDGVNDINGLIDDIDLELGDIFININASIRQAKEYGHSLKREVCFLFTHGLLHLLGYDHQSVEEEKAMFKLQHKILDDYISR